MYRVVPGLLGAFGPGTLVVKPGRTSRVCPELSQDFLGSLDKVVKPGRTSKDVPSCPRTSWDLSTWDIGSQA